MSFSAFYNFAFKPVWIYLLSSGIYLPLLPLNPVTDCPSLACIFLFPGCPCFSLPCFYLSCPCLSLPCPWLSLPYPRLYLLVPDVSPIDPACPYIILGQWWAKYIRMSHYVPNKYPNIFGSHIFTQQISKYICTLEIAQIQYKLYLWVISFKYSNIHTHHRLNFFLKGSIMLPLNKMLYWIFFYT